MATKNIEPEMSTENRDNKFLTILSFVGSFIEPLVGIIAGHVALKEYKKDGAAQNWKPLALAGTIIGYVGFFLRIQIVLMFIVAMSPFGNSHHMEPCGYNYSYNYNCNYPQPIPMPIYDVMPMDGMGYGASSSGSTGTIEPTEPYTMSPDIMVK